MSLPTLDQYDLSKLEIVKPSKKLQSQGETFFLNSKQFEATKGRVVFEIPKGTIAYTVDKYTGKPNDGEENKVPKYNMQITCDEKDPEIKKLFTAYKKFEAGVAEVLAKNSEELFFEKMDASEIKALMKPKSSIVRHKNKKTMEVYPDTLRIRVPYDRNTGLFTCKLFDGADDNKPLMVNVQNVSQMLPWNTTGIYHVCVTKVWYSGGNIGITLQLVQASVNRPTMSNYALELPSIGVATDTTVGRERTETTTTTSGTGTTSSDTEPEVKPKGKSKSKKPIKVELSDSESDEANDKLESDGNSSSEAEPSPPVKRKSKTKVAKEVVTTKTKAKAKK